MKLLSKLLHIRNSQQISRSVSTFQQRYVYDVSSRKSSQSNFTKFAEKKCACSFTFSKTNYMYYAIRPNSVYYAIRPYCANNSDKLSGDKAQKLESSDSDDFFGIESESDVKSQFVTSSDDIEDVEEFNVPDDIQPAWKAPVSFERAKDAIFTLDDVVALLEDAKACDVCVLKLPQAVQFVDYMIIISAFSFKHMKAIANNIKYVHKRRRGPKDHFLKIEGKNTNDWFALDLGNIMLHIFMPETREYYDLETLWTVGVDYDSQVRETSGDNTYQQLSQSDLLLLKLGLNIEGLKKEDSDYALEEEDSDDAPVSDSDVELGLDNRP